MRVIAGKARRLTLKSIPGLDTRPTIDRIKETLFNILSPYVPGSYFLDLFSGSGSIGIEALSRGARLSVFVENNPKAVKCINENLAFTRLADDALVLQKNAVSAINELSLKKYKFDIVYMDPPYQAGLEEETLKALEMSSIIDEDTLIIIEADKHNNLDFLENTNFHIEREKIYKTNKHYFIRLGDML
ncbi:MAG: 16S rRNA (guanine(966)-N(2))-methyltransferase RsmD [Lachnospiraceae bacterium]|nr:16S rRNA (guanine(966)-N(2))-methyltransferase RsmD [Lachnospiraceae bacterium]